MKKLELMSETKIGEKLSIGASCEGKEIGLYVASEDVSCSIAFIPEEWALFVQNISEINRRLEKSRLEK